MAIKVKLRKNPDRNGFHQIQVIYGSAGVKWPVSVGKVKKIFWDEDGGKVTPDHIQAPILNKAIIEQIEKFDLLKRKCESEGYKPEVKTMKTMIPKVKVRMNVLQSLEEYKKHEYNRGAATRPIDTLAGALKKYVKVNGELYFEDLDRNFRDTFEIGCLDGRWTKKNGIVNSTFMVYLSTLVRFLKWASRNNLTRNDDYKYFNELTSQRIKSTVKESPALTKDEILAIYNLDHSKHYDQILGDPALCRESIDAFVFNCCMGLRYVDLTRMTVNWIEESEYGLMMKRLTKKRKTMSVVLLNDLAIEIYSKYSKGKGPEDKLFNVYGNSYLNKFLKDWSKVAGLNRPFTLQFTKGREIITKTVPLHEAITSHCARTTKATTFVADSIRAQGHCDPSTLMSVIGWSSLTSAETYIKSVSGSILEQQAKIRSFNQKNN